LQKYEIFSLQIPDFLIEGGRRKTWQQRRKFVELLNAVNILNSAKDQAAMNKVRILKIK